MKREVQESPQTSPVGISDEEIPTLLDMLQRAAPTEEQMEMLLRQPLVLMAIGAQFQRERDAKRETLPQVCPDCVDWEKTYSTALDLIRNLRQTFVWIGMDSMKFTGTEAGDVARSRVKDIDRYLALKLTAESVSEIPDKDRGPHEVWCDTQRGISDLCNCMAGSYIERIAELELRNTTQADSIEALVIENTRYRTALREIAWNVNADAAGVIAEQALYGDDES